VAEHAAATVSAVRGTKKGLVYPTRTVDAPRISDVTDPRYKPAESGEGLAEIGGLADWWDQPGHWDASKDFVGFGLQGGKVTDPAVLEVLTRRAVVEALALKSASGVDKNKLGAALPGTRALLDQTVGIELVVGAEDGKLALRDELDGAKVLGLLKQAAVDGAATKEELSVELAVPIAAEEARQLAKSWDAGWKKAAIDDAAVKFYIAKRIQRLTGHVVADFKLLGVHTVQNLLAQLVKPPKAKKLTEVLELKGELTTLPNVAVFQRRVTPVDKEKMVGRWKVIRKELEKRDLPVIGTATHGKSPELRWALGDA